MASNNYGVDISPANLKNGSLRDTFDTVTHPGTRGYGAQVLTGTAKVGGPKSAENSAAPQPVDPGAGAYEGEGDTATPTQGGAGAKG